MAYCEKIKVLISQRKEKWRRATGRTDTELELLLRAVPGDYVKIAADITRMPCYSGRSGSRQCKTCDHNLPNPPSRLPRSSGIRELWRRNKTRLFRK